MEAAEQRPLLVIDPLNKAPHPKDIRAMPIALDDVCKTLNINGGLPPTRRKLPLIIAPCLAATSPSIFFGQFGPSKPPQKQI